MRDMYAGSNAGLTEIPTPNDLKERKIQEAKEEVLRVFGEASSNKDSFAAPICGLIAPTVAKAVEQALRKVLE